MIQTTKETKEERKTSEDNFAREYERLRKVSYHSTKLLEDTKNAKIRNFAEKFEAETAPIIKKCKEETQEQHDIYHKGLDRLYDKYFPDGFK